MDKEKEKKLEDTIKKELTKAYVRGISHGYRIAISDINEVMNDDGFDIKKYIAKELKLREDMDEPLNNILNK